MRGIAAVGINDNLAPGQTGVARRPADDKAPGRVDEIAGVRRQHFRRNHGADDVLHHRRVNVRVGDFGVVLGGDDDGIHRHGLTVLVGNGHLRLAVGPQPRQRAVLAHFSQAAGQAVREGNRSRHVFRRFVAREAEHHALIARTDFVGTLRAGFQRVINAHGDIRALRVDARQHGAGVAVKAEGGIIVADVQHNVAHDGGNIHLRRRGDFAHHHHHAGGGAGFAGDAAHGVLGEQRVQHRVRHLIAQLVRMTFRDRFRGKEFPHFCSSFQLSQ